VGRVVVSQFVTVDGVFEDPGGSEGHERGAWAFQFDRGDEGDKFKLDEVMGSDALLLGRVTYEGFAAAWPSRSGDPFSDKFNAMPKYVVSTTLETATWNNSTIVSDDVADRVRALKEDQNLLVWGSPSLVQFLADNGLVDEYVLLYSPIVRGKGIKLFGGAQQQLTLKVAESTVLSGGMLAVKLESA